MCLSARAILIRLEMGYLQWGNGSGKEIAVTRRGLWDDKGDSKRQREAIGRCDGKDGASDVAR